LGSINPENFIHLWYVINPKGAGSGLEIGLESGIRPSMAEISQSVTELIHQLGRLPGIGKKTAERLAYHLLRVHVSEAIALADAIRKVRENVRYCSMCFNLSEEALCGICTSGQRDSSMLIN
jgi:Holliday junction resolvasome RuvABC DNA-binding subunit